MNTYTRVEPRPPKGAVDRNSDEGFWTIQYENGKLKYVSERTDRELAEIAPNLLDALLALIGRPQSDYTRALVERYWPLSDGF